MEKQEMNFNLDWVEDSKMENGGFWVCPICNAVYFRPQNWIPKTNYCMKCKTKWFNEVEN